MRTLAAALAGLALLLGGVRAARADADERYRAAVALYEAGQLEEAERAFRALVAEEGPHPDALLGLGNTAYRQGRWAAAVYAYEWARVLAPGMKSARTNLALARAHLVVDVFPTSRSPAAEQALDLLSRVPGRASLVAGLVAWALGWLLLLARQRGRLEGWTWLAVGLIIAAIPAFAHAGWQGSRLAGPPEAVLQQPEVDVRSGPGESYQVLYTLHAGTIVTALEERPGWRRARLPDATEGWLPSDAVAIVGDISTLPD